MKSTKISTYFIFISFFTFISILVAIIQKSYSNLMGPINKVQTASYDKVINSQLDLEIIDEIEKRPINFDENNPNIINFSSESSSLITPLPLLESP
ncbi:MAG: hypothetical protein PHX34_00945 [Candidatus Shapirobacteria bacterium]|nr:hypothetical protein [Candidatus Shapirobacteria bacterium]